MTDGEELPPPKPRWCKDCVIEAANAGVGIRKPRPAPHPGPRCVSHHRTAVKSRRQKAHEARVGSVYGLLPGEYKDLYEYQDGTCFMCRRATGATKRLAVDHEHSSGVVRQLACGPCNSVLAHVRSDPEVLRRMIESIEDPPAVRLLGYRGGEGLEIWRAVPGYGGWYEASTLGRVRSWRGVGSNGSTEAPRRTSPLVMSQAETRGAYLFVALSKDGTVQAYRTNRLVLATFCGDEPELQACHADGNRTNNRLSNLRWDTAQGDSDDKVIHGTVMRGESTGNSVLTEADVIEARRIWGDPDCDIGAVQLGARYGVSGPTIWKAVTGKTWKHVKEGVDG